MKSVLEELHSLRKTLHETLENYAAHLEQEIGQIETAVSACLTADSVASSRHRDLRDMLTMLRHTEVKPEKGRRKDLKKLDTLIGDLHSLSDRWSG